MKRKTSTIPTKIWSFGALRPTENAELFHEQLFQANRYYNTLIEIERKRRDAFREARSQVVPELGALEVEYQQLDQAYEAGVEALPKPPSVKGKKQKKVLTPELLVMKERKRAISEQMRVLRKRFAEDEHAKSQLEHINEQAHLAVKAARAETTLYWGTYLMVENQIDQARKSKLDPRFRRYNHEGRVGTQIQGGLTVSELKSGEDTRLQLVPRGITKIGRNREVTGSGKSAWSLRIRIGSNGRAPIWSTIPIILHREIPPDASIKWAWIKVSNPAGSQRYDVQLAMESASFSEFVPGRGTAAINFGWRANDDGSKRVAYLVDAFGHEEALNVPADIEESIQLSHQLRSARDLHFEEAKRAVMAFMALHGADDWLKEQTKFIAQWRSPRQLVKIAHALAREHLEDHYDDLRRWRMECLSQTPKKDLFAPAAEIMEWFGKRGSIVSLSFYLELWRIKNRHLWEWETRAQEKALGRRKQLFRNWVRRIADTYSEILIEDFDLREMAKTPDVDEDPRHKGFRSDRAVASPGELRARLVEVGRHKIVKGEAKHNTTKCFECGHLNDRFLGHRGVCAGCGVTWDQDANNCRNQLGARAVHQTREALAKHEPGEYPARRRPTWVIPVATSYQIR